MSNFDGLPAFRDALQERRQGLECPVDSDAEWNEIKPYFYADSFMVLDQVHDTLLRVRADAGDLGLVDRNGNPLTTLEHRRGPWSGLEEGVRSTMLFAFEDTLEPSTLTECPYHELLARRLGKLPLRDATKAKLRDVPEVIEFYEDILLAGAFAPSTIVPILSRMPAMKAFHGAASTPHELAKNSRVSLLKDPLLHAQQRATAFVFTLTGSSVRDLTFKRKDFLPERLIARYTKLGATAAGKECIQWSLPTTDFVITTDVRVAERTKGSVTDADGDHVTVYAEGTRLGEIEVTEPTIGCPGRKLAYALWNLGTDAAETAGLYAEAA